MAQMLARVLLSARRNLLLSTHAVMLNWRRYSFTFVIAFDGLVVANGNGAVRSETMAFRVVDECVRGDTFITHNWFVVNNGQRSSSQGNHSLALGNRRRSL